MQIAVSIVGILMMTAPAYYRSWSKNADKAPTKIKPLLPDGRLILPDGQITNSL
jgi:hypothetical protein